MMLLALFIVAVTTTGPSCALPGSAGPVPHSVVSARQLSQRGLRALERSDLDNAQRLLAQAVKACPTDNEARRHYAEALWRAGHVDEAITHLAEAIRLSGEDAALVARLAEMQSELGRYQLAHDHSNRAIQVNPKLATAWFVRGQAAHQLGQPRDALADYHRALSLSPSDRRCLLHLAELYRELNQPQPALGALQSLLDTYEPGDEPVQVLYLEGLAYSALERYQEAADAFALVAARGGASAEVLYQLANAEYRLGRPSEAQQRLNQALAIEPGHMASTALLGEMSLARSPQQAPRHN